MFDFGDVQVVVDRGSFFYLDEPLRIDYDEREQAFRLRCNSQVIPNRFKL